MEAVDLNFGKGAPAAGLPKDKFSARYTFWYQPEKDVKLELAITSDDGSRLKVDGKEVIDNWSNHKMLSRQTGGNGNRSLQTGGRRHRLLTLRR